MIAEEQRLAERRHAPALEALGPYCPSGSGHRPRGLFGARHAWDYFRTTMRVRASTLGRGWPAGISTTISALLRRGAVERAGSISRAAVRLTGSQEISEDVKEYTSIWTPRRPIPT